MAEDTKKSFIDRAFKGDKTLWRVVAMLAIASLLVVYSSTASMAWRMYKGDMSHYFIRQVMYLIVAFGGMYVTYMFNYQFYYKISRPIFFLSLVSVALLFVVGESRNEAARWLRIPGSDITIQPSDFIRVTVIMLLARELAKRQKIIDKIAILPSLTFGGWAREPKKNMDILRNTTIPLLLPTALACGAIYVSNFSTAAMTFLTCWVMLYIGRVKKSELWKLMGIVTLVVSVAVITMATFDIGRSRVWVNRLVSFTGVTVFQIDGYRQGDDGYQKNQAKIAVAAGWPFGTGPGKSTQRANLPHSDSDFAYAFIIEEYGLIGGVVVLALYLWLFFRTIVIFQRCGTAFPSLLVLGLGLMIAIQAFINIYVSVGLGPVTGQPLPVISRGGTSLVFTSIALGMILGVSRQMEEQSLDKPKGESMLA